MDDDKRLDSGRARAISRDDLINLPIRRYEGPVHLIDSADAAEQAANDIRAERVVGLDTETRPAFRKGESYLPCLAQVATARAVYIFTLRVGVVLPVLATMLESPQTIKAGVALADDLRGLQQVFEFGARQVIDLGDVARRAGCRQTGVRNLAGLYLGFRIPKGARTSNWAAPRLTPAQITYAATDAWVCREIYLKFEETGLTQ